MAVPNQRNKNTRCEDTADMLVHDNQDIIHKIHVAPYFLSQQQIL